MNLRLRPGKNKLFLRVALWTVLVIMVPVFGLCLQSVSTAKMLNETSVVTNTEAMAERVANALSLLYNNVGMQSQQIAVNSTCKSFIQYKNGAELEAERAPYQNLQETYAYVQAKSALRTLISKYLTEQQLLSTIYYCDVNKNLIISCRAPDSTIERFYDLKWLEGMDWQTGEWPRVLSVRRVTPPLSIDELVLSMVYMPYIDNPDICFVFNLDAKYLFDNYINNGQLLPTDQVYITDAKGQRLLSWRDSALVLDDDQPLPEANASTLVCTSSIQSPGWQLVIVRDLDVLLADNMGIARSFLILSACLLIFAVALMLLVNMNVYRPIDRWSMQVQGHETEGKVNWLTRGTEVESFGEWLKVSGTALRARFWSQAVMGKVAQLDQFRHVHFRIQLQNFLLAVVAIESSDEAHTGENIIASAALAQMLRQRLGMKDCDVVELTGEEILILVNCPRDQQSEVTGRLIDVYRSITQDVLNASDIAVGGFCETLGDACECYNRAKMLLQYQRITGSLQTQYSITVESSLSSAMARLWEMEKSLVFSLQHHNYDEAEHVFASIRSEIENNLPSMDYFQIKHRILCLLTQMLDNYQRENGPANATLSFPEDIYARMLKSDNLDTVWETGMELISSMRAADVDKCPPDQKGHVALIIRMLEDNYGRDMNLAQISEKLGMSAVYISKIFKQSTGENYSQYLTRRRMEAAKEMLLRGDMQVQEIADHLGYSQGHYFAKVFKQYCGLTPSEFVQQRRE